MSLEVRNLSCGYGTKKILEDVTFNLDNGQTVGLLGLNGCGKTTLIKSICGIIPSSGDIRIDALDTRNLSAGKFARLCSLVPQKSGIGIDISVLDVVLMGFNPFLKLLENPTREMRQKAEQILSRLGISEMANSNFMKLSEGQKQLVIIARALVADTKVLIMDEPESSLDFSVRYDVLEVISSQIKNNGRSALVSLHDINLALKFCDKLLLIKDGAIASYIDVKEDSERNIEQKLSDIYGDIKLINTGNSLVMVKA